MSDKRVSPVAAKPSVGPFYWTYLRPTWRLIGRPTASEGDNLGHPDFWEFKVARVIARHYEIADQGDLASLLMLPYSMPRGRVARQLDTGNWAVYVGKDLPASLDTPARRDEILRMFGVAALPVEFIHDEHETMQSEDSLRLRNILGIEVLCGEQG